MLEKIIGSTFYSEVTSQVSEKAKMLRLRANGAKYRGNLITALFDYLDNFILRPDLLSEKRSRTAGEILYYQYFVDDADPALVLKTLLMAMEKPAVYVETMAIGKKPEIFSHKSVVAYYQNSNWYLIYAPERKISADELAIAGRIFMPVAAGPDFYKLYTGEHSRPINGTSEDSLKQIARISWKNHYIRNFFKQKEIQTEF